MSTTDRNIFVQAVLDLYLGLPHSAARRPSRNDRRLAEHLFERRVPLKIVRAAMLLAIARRSQRPIDAPPLTPIRSLYYFTPVIDELLTSPADQPSSITSSSTFNTSSPDQIDLMVILIRFLMAADISLGASLISAPGLG